MPDPPEPAASPAIAAAARFAALGHAAAATEEDLIAAEAAVRDDHDPRVRQVALAALVRLAPARRARAAWTGATADAHPAVRRRAAELAPPLGPGPAAPLLALLADPDPLVAEAAAAALGEIGWAAPELDLVVGALADAAREHPDPLVRESAVAALGSLGHPDGLAAILAACGDRPAIRRRAVLALAPFTGADVDRAITKALTDTDWQVRQAAEDLS